jgi:ATP-dependent exoDNAse (exonuclease V) alpha subunit
MRNTLGSKLQGVHEGGAIPIPDRRFSEGGREVIGAAMAWQQADALQDAGIDKTYAIASLLTEIESGGFHPSRNTVLVLDEVSQIGPRSMLKLLELQAKTGMTIKMLGDLDQAQAIEAGDSIEVLRRVMPPEALPGLMTTMRQSTRRGREVAGLFREGNAQLALDMKRADGHAMMVGGDRDQVVARIADLYIARRDHLLASGSKRGVTVSAPTNDDVAEISQAIRERLKRRGEIGGHEKSYPAVDRRNEHYDLSIATVTECACSGASRATSTVTAGMSATMATCLRCWPRTLRISG